MKRKKLFILLGIVTVLIIGTATATYAATAISDPEAFMAERLVQIRERLDDAVEDGRLTAIEADEIYADREERIKDRIADGTCDGIPKRDGDGKGFGKGFGMGRGNCNG